jgi:hypothetical protein
MGDGLYRENGITSENVRFCIHQYFALESVPRLIYYLVLVQASFSGLIAGQRGEGSRKSGVKYSCIRLVITLPVFNNIR